MASRRGLRQFEGPSSSSLLTPHFSIRTLPAKGAEFPASNAGYPASGTGASVVESYSESIPPPRQACLIHSTLFRAVVGASLILLPVACATDSTGPVDIAPATVFPMRYLSTVGAVGVNLPQIGLRGMGFGGVALQVAPGALPGSKNADLAARLSAIPEGALAVMVLASPACTPDVVGGGTDSDGDGIPNDATYTFTAANCTTYDSATGEAYLTRGSYRVRDTNDDLYGFQFDVNALTISRKNGAPATSFADVVYNINESARTTATGGTYHFVADATSDNGDATQFSAQRTRYDLTETFTPTATIPAGGPLPDGTMTISGTAEYDLTETGPPARVVLQLVGTSPLLYDDACPGLTGGEFEMRLNGSPTEGIHILYAACAGHYEPIGAGTL